MFHQTVSLPESKASLLWPRVAKVTVAVLSLVTLTSLGAWVRIPLPNTPVPITFQDVVVLMGAATLGGSLGGVSLLMYLALGSFGLPIFANVTVLTPYLLGPTGGYLVGFVAAAFFIGLAMRRSSYYSIWQIAAIFAAAQLLIFIPGLVQLGIWLQQDIYTTLTLGFLPFLPVTLIKLTLLTGFYNRFQDKIRRRFTF